MVLLCYCERSWPLERGRLQPQHPTLAATQAPIEPTQLNKHMKTYEITPHMTTHDKQLVMREIINAATRALAAKGTAHAD
jgi:hypothetical protein